MAVRSGADYMAGLRDGRAVWLDGEPVADVTRHPALAPAIRTIASLYDEATRPEYAELLTYVEPSTGERCSASFLLPRTPAELAHRHAVARHYLQLHGGLLGRSPDHLGYTLGQLVRNRDLISAGNAEYEDNLLRYYAYCRDRDLCVAHAFTDPLSDRSRPVAEWPMTRIVEERCDGIVVHGPKSLATLAPQADELVLLPAVRPGLPPEACVYFAVPIDTPGLRLVCREPQGGEGHAFDHPLRSRFDEMDALVIFDHVFVPRERVFGRVDPAQVPAVFGRLFVNHIGSLLRLVVKAEFMLGLAAQLARATGTFDTPATQGELSKMVVYVQTLRAYVMAAEAAAITRPDGACVPHPAPLGAAKGYAVEHYRDLVNAIQEIGGQGLVMTPQEGDLAATALADDLEAIFSGPAVSAAERTRLFKLAWDLTGDGFGGRQLLFELFQGGAAQARRAPVHGLDLGACEQMARRLAGLGAPAGAPPAPLTGAATAGVSRA